MGIRNAPEIEKAMSRRLQDWRIENGRRKGCKPCAVARRYNRYWDDPEPARKAALEAYYRNKEEE